MSADTLIEHLRSAGYGESAALCWPQGSCSHKRLLRLADELAAELRARGIATGDTVLIAGETCPELIAALLAVPATGAISVPLALPVASERLAWIVATTQASLCLVAGAVDLPGTLEVPCLSLRLNDAAMEVTPPRTAPHEQGASRAEIRKQPDSVIRFTSGSTGRPKGVVLSHAAVLAGARTVSQVFSFDRSHRELLLVSMAGSGGWQRVAATLYAGGCVCFGSGPVSLTALLDDFAAFSASAFFSPPPLIRLLLQESPAKLRKALSGCRSIEIGSAPISGTELNALLDLLPWARIFVHYGLTECSRATALDARRNPERLHTSGQPTPGTAVRILDEQGGLRAPGETGEIAVRGPQIAGRYWNDAALTEASFRNGWLATGDYGTIDADGFLAVAGRRDDLINCAGHCFFPAEAERELGPVDGLRDYLIAGVADPRGVLCQVPWLFAVPADAEAWSPAGLLQQARRRLPAHMRPRRVVMVSQLPLTASGKPDRRGTVRQFGNTGSNQ